MRQRQTGQADKLGIYIHIPFCRSKCDYCDFYSLSGREDRMDDYQKALLAHLREEGFDVTQATVSRDIRELQLVKTATADGRYRYVPASASGKVTHSPSRFEMLFRESVLKVDYAGNTVLVKCFSGMANAACEVFDAKQWDNVVGTLSGDDTFFILMRTPEAAAEICKQLQQYTRRG